RLATIETYAFVGWERPGGRPLRAACAAAPSGNNDRPAKEPHVRDPRRQAPDRPPPRPRTGRGEGAEPAPVDGQGVVPAPVRALERGPRLRRPARRRALVDRAVEARSEEHTSELQS